MSDERPRTSGVFYGWVIAACALLALLVSNGMTISGITVFDEALLKEFGWSRADLKLRDLLQFGLSGLLAPFIGAVADRFSLKRLMLGGAGLLALCFAAYSRLESLTGLYLIHVGIALVLALVGLVLNVLLVSRWFVRKRGTAIGIALVGTSLGGTLLPPLGRWLIASYGWRTAFLIEAALPFLLLLVLWLFVYDAPEDKGLVPLGAHDAGHGGPPAGSSGLSFAEALGTWTFWALALCAMTTFYSILAVASHLFLHLRGLGFSPASAANGLGMLFLMGLVGKFLFGWLADVLDRKLVFLTNIGVMLAGSLCLSSLRPELFWPFIVLFGFGWGGLYTLLQLLVMDSFGLKAGGKILGTITVLDALGGGLGPWVTGLLYDRTGSYQSGFMLITGLVAFAFVLGATLRPRAHRAAAPAGAR
ncbi:MAG: MFS transporter [Vicinamibacteria bacterium]